jgi:hypothetical protein
MGMNARKPAKVAVSEATFYDRILYQWEKNH